MQAQMTTRTKYVPTQSFYVQLTSSRDFDSVRQAMYGLARVRGCGRGTASDPDSYWFELEFDAPEPITSLKEHLLAGLTPFNVTLRRLQPVSAGMGASLAKQLDLFGGA